ncbi:MAG: spore cortex-lytic enzyme [Bacillota bacterium]
MFLAFDNNIKRAAPFILAALLVVGLVVWRGAGAFGQDRNLYWGSSGPDVTKVQAQLNRWGYYTGPIDGYYSGKTFQAVQEFQRKNGLIVDGVVGPQTWAALGLPTARQAGTAAASAGVSRGVSDRSNVYLLARVIEGEAADEPYLGKVAVGAVIVNRTRSGVFPSSLAGVIFQPHAFESVTNGQYTRPVSPESLRAAQEALSGWDPTGGALFFWNPYKPVNPWIWSRQLVTQIGRHVFAR